MADSSDDLPVSTTVSVSGATSLARSITSMPLSPGMSRSTIRQSYELRARAAAAVVPSGQTVTS